MKLSTKIEIYTCMSPSGLPTRTATVFLQFKQRTTCSLCFLQMFQKTHLKASFMPSASSIYVFIRTLQAICVSWTWTSVFTSGWAANNNQSIVIIKSLTFVWKMHISCWTRCSYSCRECSRSLFDFLISTTAIIDCTFRYPQNITWINGWVAFNYHLAFLSFMNFISHTL